MNDRVAMTQESDKNACSGPQYSKRPWFKFYTYRRSDFPVAPLGPGFWLLIGRTRFCGDVTYPSSFKPFSERYSGQHGIPKRHVVYVPLTRGRHLRLEVMHERRR